MKTKMLVFIVLLFCLLTGFLEAQQENGVRFIKRQAWKGYWYDTSTAMFQVRYPILQTFPPITTNMPYEIMLSYLYLDSLCRYTYGYETDSIIDSYTQMNDTLRYAAKYLYLIKDYDPARYKQYCDEVTLHQKSEGGLIVTYLRDPFAHDTINDQPPGASGFSFYKNWASGIEDKIIFKYLSFIPEEDRYAVFAMLNSDFILKIRVLAIDSMPNKNSPLVYNRYNVTAELLDTLKGKNIETFIPQQITNISNRKNILMPLPENPIINFQYTPKNYLGYNVMYHDGENRQVRDSDFTNSNGEFKMEVGQVAVIFLEYCNGKMDYYYDYYDLDLCPHCSNNALPIIDGTLRDVKYIWSGELYMDYEQWQFLFNQVKDRIINREY